LSTLFFDFMTLGEKIAAARREMGKEWTQAKLASELARHGLKMTRGWLASAETGRIRPHREDLETLAKVLKKPLDFFEDDETTSPGPSHFGDSAPVYGMQIIRVPVVGVAGADTFAFNFDDPPLEPVTIPVEGSTTKRYGAFRIRGDCMEPRFHNGEIVVVAESSSVPDGVPGVFRLHAGCTLKIPHRRPDGIELRPTNPKFKSHIFRTNELTVVGVVITVTRKP
jgi:phage repressor protein C with HTH and peptisase S24 domain